MKQCFKCSKVLPLDDFYKHKAMADGHLNKCKDCTKLDALNRRNENLEAIRAYDRNRPNAAERNKEKIALRRKRREEAPGFDKPYRTVKRAVDSGKIVKPDCCERCGKSNERLEGHHEDYEKILDVIWLCSACHKARHKEMNRGIPYVPMRSVK